MQESLSTEEPTKVKKEENKQEKKTTETTEAKSESETDEQVDMSGMINRFIAKDSVCHTDNYMIE